jgi:excisionase family DNA binding protein
MDTSSPSTPTISQLACRSEEDRSAPLLSSPHRFADLPDVLTVTEAAKALRLGRNAAYEAVAQQLIPSLRIGRRILIPKAGLVRLLSGDVVNG